MIIKKIWFSFLLFPSFELYSSEQECKELLKAIIEQNYDGHLNNRQDLNRLKKMLLLHPHLANRKIYSIEITHSLLPLHHALLGANLGLMKILLHAGADPNLSYVDCLSPVSAAQKILAEGVRHKAGDAPTRLNIYSVEDGLSLLMRYGGMSQGRRKINKILKGFNKLV